MRSSFILLSLLFLIQASACSSLRNSAKYELDDGYYTAIPEEGPKHRVYVLELEDSLIAFPLSGRGSNRQIDSSRLPTIALPASGQSAQESLELQAYSLDIDVLAIPFKYRQPAADMPRTLSTQFNGGLYGGFRTDHYRIHYESGPVGPAERIITHYGYSIGLFTGIGAESINPWVTQDQYPGEYEGVVWLNGIGGIVGINNFTFGLGIGFDYLLDRNRHSWIYQGKPWLGLTLGLNLN